MRADVDGGDVLHARRGIAGPMETTAFVVVGGKRR
jgi:hypothetical protein